MNRNQIIAAAVVVGLANHLEKVPEHPRTGHPVTEQHVNMADSYSVNGSIDHTDADDRGIDIEMSI